MGPDSCNLGNEEVEVLKPSSPSSSPQNPSFPAAPSSQLAPQTPPSCFPLKPSNAFSSQRSESSETVATAIKLSSLPKPKEVSRQPVLFRLRCLTCQKRVGLTGFRCRCGDLFCARHRYSDTHSCSFDYKSVGREEIAKANPVIRAAKIIRI